MYTRNDLVLSKKLKNRQAGIVEWKALVTLANSIMYAGLRA